MECEGRCTSYQFPAVLSSQKFEGQDTHLKIFAILMSLGALKASEEKSNSWPRTAWSSLLRIPNGKFPLFFPVSFSTQLPCFLPSLTRSIWLCTGLLLHMQWRNPVANTPKIWKSLYTDRTMALAHRCQRKRAHHTSYLTHKWIQGEKAANTHLSQVSSVWVYDFQQAWGICR